MDFHKIPFNSISDSLTVFPTKSSQHDLSSALLFSILYFFARLQHKGSDMAQAMYTSSPITFKGATLVRQERVGSENSLHNCTIFAKSDVLCA